MGGTPTPAVSSVVFEGILQVPDKVMTAFCTVECLIVSIYIYLRSLLRTFVHAAGPDGGAGWLRRTAAGSRRRRDEGPKNNVMVPGTSYMLRNRRNRVGKKKGAAAPQAPGARAARRTWTDGRICRVCVYEFVSPCFTRVRADVCYSNTMTCSPATPAPGNQSRSSPIVAFVSADSPVCV